MGDGYADGWDLELLIGGAAAGIVAATDAITPNRPRTSDEPEPLLAEPAIGDLDAAVALVHEGLANRIVLTGFASWPGLLWHAYELASLYDVLILPTVVRPGGRVDIVITREPAAGG
jgi:hypothetical protein